tara:strand:- start:5272 stop:8256 length:2985 start_codon:yes stop_codon:yes gene_type:complete
MATLQKNYDYSNVLWEEIYQRIKTIIRDEYNVSPYISPELNTKINSPFRIWSDLEGTESLFVGGWHKMYTISINQYFKKEDSERFYQRLYQDSERLYQLFFNNQGTQEAELLGFFDGKPQEVSISEEDEYFRVEVIFTCNVFRHDDAIYVETSPASIRAAIRAIEPSYNFWSLSFDGTDDEINIGLESLSAGSSFTFSAWINGDDFASTDKTIISNGQLTNHRLFSIEGGKLFLQIYNGGYTGDNVTKAKASTAFSTNVWYNAVCTFDGSNIKLYINGVEETTTVDGAGSTGNVSNTTTIGYLLRSTKESFFNGQMSEVAIFNTALSSSTIQTMYNNGTPILLTRNQGSYNSSGNLVAYYRMGSGDSDDKSTNGLIADQVDTSVSSNILTDYNMATDTWTVVNFTYDATNDGYRYDDNTTGRIGTTPTGGSDTISLSPGTYKIQFTLLDGSVANGDCRLLFRTREPDPDHNTTHTLLSAATYLSSPNGTTYTRYAFLPATSDELEIYAYHPQSDDFLIKDILLFKVGGNGGILNNFDGLDFKTNVPQIYDKALFSNSLAFDGTDEYMDVLDFSYDVYNSGDTQPFSISIWFKKQANLTSDDNAKGAILYDDGFQMGLRITYQSSTNQIRIHGQTGGIGESNHGNGWDFYTSYDSNWHHVVWTVEKNATNYAKNSLYLDGVQVQIRNGDGGTSGANRGTGTFNSGTGLWEGNVNFDEQTSQQLYRTTSTLQIVSNDQTTNAYSKFGNTIRIGRDRALSSYFHGSMADLAFFTTTLDSSNVAAIYNSGKPIDLTCDAGNYNNANNLKAYWKMGDGYLDQLPSLSPGLIIDQVSPIIGEELVVDNPYVADYYQLYTNNTISTISGRSVTINFVDDNAGVKIYLNNTVYSNATGILKSNPIDNELYLVSIDVVSDGTGQLFLQNVAAGNVYSQVSGSGTHKFLFKEKPSASATIRIINFSAGDGTFMTWSNISVKKVEGYPAFTQNMNASAQSISVPT